MALKNLCIVRGDVCVVLSYYCWNFYIKKPVALTCFMYTNRRRSSKMFYLLFLEIVSAINYAIGTGIKYSTYSAGEMLHI